MIVPFTKSNMILLSGNLIFKGITLKSEKLLLDTGAKHIYLNEYFASILDFTSEDVQQNILTHIGGGTVATKIYQLDSFENLGYTQNFPLVRIYPFKSELSKYDGVIGMSFFRSVLAHLGLNFLKNEVYTI
jgi:hypothetical protein